MILRGHHLFCTALYGGAGYSETFCRRMGDLLARQAAEEPMELTVGPDELCGACPHKTLTGGCALGTENVLRRDENALAVLGLTSGEAVTWARVRPRLAAVSDEAFVRVCGECRWQRQGFCTAALLRERTGE